MSICMFKSQAQQLAAQVQSDEGADRASCESHKGVGDALLGAFATAFRVVEEFKVLKLTVPELQRRIRADYRVVFRHVKIKRLPIAVDCDRGRVGHLQLDYLS
jgi:hypothetical protein